MDAPGKLGAASKSIRGAFVFSIRYFPPCEALHGRVASYYVMEAAHGVQLDIHDFAIPVWPNLRFLLRGDIDVTVTDTIKFAAPPAQCALFGGTTVATHVHIKGALKIVGASFFPRGWREIFATPANAWANRAGQLGDVWGYEPAPTLLALANAKSDADTVSALDRLFLGRVIAGRPAKLPASTYTVERLLVDPAIISVEKISEQTGLSLRQIERISLAGYGHTPKQVIRKFRFLRTIATLAKTPDAAWRDMIDELYYDQSHFIRDFKQFTGLTPTDYQKNPPLIMRGFLQSLGSSIQLETIPARFEWEALQSATTRLASSRAVDA